MDRIAILVLTAIAIIVVLVTTMVTCARAEPAPLPQCQTQSPCKIIILSNEEEFALTGPNQILDTAMQGRPLDLSGKVLYYRDKLRNAPAGAPLEAPKQ